MAQPVGVLGTRRLAPARRGIPAFVSWKMLTGLFSIQRPSGPGLPGRGVHQEVGE